MTETKKICFPIHTNPHLSQKDSATPSRVLTQTEHSGRKGALNGWSDFVAMTRHTLEDLGSFASILLGNEKCEIVTSSTTLWSEFSKIKLQWWCTQPASFIVLLYTCTSKDETLWAHWDRMGCMPPLYNGRRGGGGLGVSVHVADVSLTGCMVYHIAYQIWCTSLTHLPLSIEQRNIKEKHAKCCLKVAKCCDSVSYQHV